MKGKLVFPGDLVAVSEEYIAGEGTYEDEGDIYAAQVGELQLDPRDKVARVRGLNPPVELKVGDIVLGTVEDIKPTMAVVNIEAVEGIDRAVTGETEGTVHISKISEGYTEDIRKELRLGDVVRARVIQVKPSLQLATNEKLLGVVRGLCTRCRAPMVKRGRELYCQRCERSEPRKIAGVYDALQSWGKG
jgi:exosome complex component CSL4